MNVFFLHNDPQICAEMHCDKHLLKMVIEYAQLLSTAHRVLDGTLGITLSDSGRKRQTYTLNDGRDGLLYSATHVNHPSAIWVRDNIENYLWLYDMWSHLLDEYTYRYGKQHSCARLICALAITPRNISTASKFFPPTPAMPAELKIVADNPLPGRKYDVLKSYHNYYNVEKRSFASWKGKVNSRPTPQWFNV